MRLHLKFLLALFGLFIICTGISFHPPLPSPSAKLLPRKAWVDSVYNTLSEDERIGQLFMVAAYSGGKNYNKDLITKLLDAHQVGGLIFMQGGPIRQALLTNEYQHMAQVPLLIAMDAEWGLGMRLDCVRNMPRQMMLGATRDTMLAYRMGAAIAMQCKRLGVHIDFAPVIDVNNNAANPVINSRSFGQDKTYVSKLGIAYMNGLQRNGVMACAKHFPGHGDTNVDSHKDLPLIPKTLSQLDTLELYPFKELVNAGVKCVMVAHLDVPSIDTACHVPTSLSTTAVTTLLKYKLGFQGIVITDALGMQGVTKYFPAGEADLRAFEAGNDILLFPQDVPAAIAKIKGAIAGGEASSLALEYSVKKILAAKYDAGLYAFKNIDTTHITDDLNKLTDDLRMDIAKKAITLVRDNNGMLNRLNKNAKIAYLGINVSTATPLYKRLAGEFESVDTLWAPKTITKDSVHKIKEKLADYDAIILAVHNISFTPANNYGLNDDELKLLTDVSELKNSIVTLMGNAYAMSNFPAAKSVLVSYEDDSITEVAVAEVLLKKTKASGILPVTAGPEIPVIAPACVIPLTMELCNPIFELQKVAKPEDAGVVEPIALTKLDQFIQRCINDGAFPGCRVMAMRDGKVVYDKPFGYLTYDKKTSVNTNTLYDMASCTKMLATTLAVMHLYEQDKLSLDKTIGDYLPAAAGTNKAGLKIKDLLCHQAGMRSWIPFFKDIIDSKGKPDKKLFKKKQSGDYNVLVAKNLYMRSDYIDTMWNRIYISPLENVGKSVYSDLDYIFLGKIVEQITGEKLDKYVEREFYKPLGLNTALFKPLEKYDVQRIAPTESETTFRNQVIQGYVHDPAAAMFGGVAGHAGLFATAQDAAIIMQMLLNGGIYKGKRYFKSATLNQFTAYQSTLNHRGYGFDKPLNDLEDGGPAGDRCSGFAFGHQGFTGTCAWADPATGIVFVFLSNRVFPSADNPKINRLNVRTAAQDYIYEALGIPVNRSRDYVYRLQVNVVKAPKER